MTIKANSFTPLRDCVFVTDMEQGMRMSRGGIILTDDNFKEHGIRPRWGRIWAVGPEADSEFKVGEWVLVEHGRWTLGMEIELPDEIIKVWRVEPKACMLASADDPREQGFSFKD